MSNTLSSPILLKVLYGDDIMPMYIDQSYSGTAELETELTERHVLEVHQGTDPLRYTCYNFTDITESNVGVYRGRKESTGFIFDICYQQATKLLIDNPPPDCHTLMLDTVVSRLQGTEDIRNAPPGIIVPYGIASMALTSTSIHVEDGLLCAANQLLCGDSKVWLVHRRGYTATEPLAGDLKPDLYRKVLKPGHPSMQLPYLLSQQHMVPIIQTRGQIIVTAPSVAGAHVTVSSGCSIAVSTNTLLVTAGSLKKHLKAVCEDAEIQQAHGMVIEAIDNIADLLCA